MIFNRNRESLEDLIPKIQQCLKFRLKLTLNPNKVSIATLASGIDFLGWVHFPKHRILRTTSKKRMFNRLEKSNLAETVSSYLGLLKHGNSHKLIKRIIEEI